MDEEEDKEVMFGLIRVIWPLVAVWCMVAVVGSSSFTHSFTHSLTHPGGRREEVAQDGLAEVLGGHPEADERQRRRAEVGQVEQRQHARSAVSVEGG